jgi:uncharacterized iron-regulated membrane protein
MGNYFGRLNQIVMVIPCLGILFLSITGPYMWWRRRPRGRLAAPRALAAPTLRTLVVLIIALAIPFPLAGASLLLCLALDGGLRALRHPRAAGGARGDAM